MSYPKFDNPYSDMPGFVDLGQHIYSTRRGNKTRIHQYDLYALVGTKHINFGARYSNELPGYISGSADLQKDGKWHILGATSEIALAAARYFANHHYSKGA